MNLKVQCGLSGEKIIQVGASQKQTWKKLIFVCKPIFGVGKCPPIHIILKHIKVPEIAFFPLYQIVSNKKRSIVDNNADLWVLMGEKCKKIVV